jgi:hypothetical protein
MNNLDPDSSMPARKRLRTIAIDEFNVPMVRDTQPRMDRAPDVDWTGHQYKAPAECTVKDYNRRGREAR